MAEVRAELDDHLRHALAGDDDSEDAQHARQYRELKLGLIAHKRATVISLRDRQLIDDTVLRQLQSQLDIEEIRLSGPVSTE